MVVATQAWGFYGSMVLSQALCSCGSGQFHAAIIIIIIIIVNNFIRIFSVKFCHFCAFELFPNPNT
jgi:hypothetical protein